MAAAKLSPYSCRPVFELKRLEARIYERIDTEFPKHASEGEGQVRYSYLSAQNFYGLDICPSPSRSPR